MLVGYCAFRCVDESPIRPRGVPRSDQQPLLPYAQDARKLLLSEEQTETLGLRHADTPLKQGKEPGLVIDVWEHPEHVDFRNERPRFVAGFWGVANWLLAAECFSGFGEDGL